jgi:hypothetical protein
MALRQIEFKEPVLLGAHRYETGDRASFPTDEAAEYIKLGWASCVQTGETGERVPGAKPWTLQLDDIVSVIE